MRLACFSPVTPRRSGIADYCEALLPHLAAHGEIDLFIEDYEPANADLAKYARVRHWKEFEADRTLYDAVLYHIGNNPQHVYIYDMAIRFPGVLVLHEFNIHYLFADVTLSRGDWEGYFRELEYNAGPEALEHARRAQRGEVQPEYERIPMNRRLLETSTGAIVHSQYMVRLIRGQGFTLPVAHIQHGVAFPEADGARARRTLGLASEPLVGTFGFLKPYKRIYSLLEAAAELRPEFPGLQLLLVGEEHPHYPLRPVIERLKLQDCTRLPGFVPLEEFADYIAACDVCVNLRFPTVGETSGSLLRELALGKPVLVSDVGAFADLPDDVCIKVPAGEGEVAWIVEYLRAFLNSQGLRESVGKNARRWAQENCSWPKVAREYAEFLTVGEFCAPGRAPEQQPSTAAAEDNSAELAEYILSFSVATRPMEDYVRTHLRRLVRTLQLTPPGGPGKRVLEMGCYMQMTPALRRYLHYEEVAGCYYGPAGKWEQKTVHSNTGEPFSCRIDLFDAEKDPYPYPDAWFDTILCCELIEHLYHDPMHMMAEINRILKPGGQLVLTTPNITSVRGVNAILNGYHPGLFHTYVVPGPGGEIDPRHNREYAPRDVKALFESAGLELSWLDTGSYEADPPRFEHLGRVLAETGYPMYLRGDIIYAVGSKVGPVRHRYPAELYTAF